MSLILQGMFPGDALGKEKEALEQCNCVKANYYWISVVVSAALQLGVNIPKIELKIQS